MNIITARDMYDYILSEIHKEVTSSVYPEEFESHINKAQHEYVENRYSQAEQIQKRIDDLRMLVAIDLIPNTGGLPGTQPGGEVFDLPYNPNALVTTVGNPSGENHGYLHLLNVGFRLAYIGSTCGLTGISDHYIKARPLPSDKEYEIVNDPFNKPTDFKLYYQIIGNRLRLISNGKSVGFEAKIQYLRYPREIQLVNAQVDCELPLHARKEICDIAVRNIIEKIQSPRYQTILSEETKQIV